MKPENFPRRITPLIDLELAIVKARRGIGMIRYLSTHVCKEVLYVIYKLHVRPYLDYGDIIYHKYDPESH